jgi:hypothetical protein
LQNGPDALASMLNCKTPDSWFRALLIEDGAERFELARAQEGLASSEGSARRLELISR